MNFDSPLPLLKTLILDTPCELRVLNKKWLYKRKKKKNCVAQQREQVIKKEGILKSFAKHPLPLILLLFWIFTTYQHGAYCFDQAKNV